MLDVTNIDVYYGNIQILFNFSMKVNDGEIVSLVGANGAGKTTLLRAISGLVGFKTGNIVFKNKSIKGLRPDRIARIGIGHIPEGRRVFSTMSVLENLELGSLPLLNNDEKRKNLEWVFHLFPILEERKEQVAGTLSGGEQQMLAVGRGLMASPKLIMLDEPSIGLSPLLVKEVFGIFGKLRGKGVTVLLVEQNAVLALRTADRGYVLSNGKVELEGKASDLLQDKMVQKVYLAQ